MHVVLDGTCLGRRKTGNETYIRGLIEGFSVLPSEAVRDLKLTVLVTDAAPLATLRHAALASRFPLHWHTIPLGNFMTRNFWAIPRALRALRADLYHGVYWIRFWSMPCPVVLMVHDLSFVSFPQGFHFHERIVYCWLVRASSAVARHLVTVSEFSKRELQHHWKIPQQKITVTFNGVHPSFARTAARSKQDESGRDQVILFVGNLHPRKNLARLVEAFVLFRKRSGLPHRLKIVGPKGWLFEDGFEAVRRHQLEAEVEFTGYVDDEALQRCYREAAVLVYPSLYEGFGLPPLEAMASGCPVIASQAASIPEVCGDAAELVDPTSVEAMATALERVLGDPAYAESLRRAGFAQATRFSWEKTAAATIEVYRKALEAKPSASPSA